MEIRYLIQKEQRKAMAQTIADLTGSPAEYLAAPTFAYQIGAFRLDKDAVLSFDDSMDENFTDMILSGLEKAGYPAEESPELLTVSMPKSFFDSTALENLKRIIANKEHLLKHALETDSLEITETEENIEFPWFSVSEPNDGDAYYKFISALCDFAKNQKRVNNKPDTSDNEKYAFRCFLLRLGMIGSEYKSVRKVLLRNLTGSSAFRHGKPKKEDSVDEISN
jgi:hypothetical protein